jgi:hypothetical protein
VTAPLGLIVLLVMTTLALVYCRLGWCLHGGALWAWFTTVILTPTLGYLLWVMGAVDSEPAPGLARIVLGLLSGLELLLLINPIRRWFFMSSRLRWKVRDLERIAATAGGMAFADTEADRLLAALRPSRYDQTPEVAFLD